MKMTHMYKQMAPVSEASQDTLGDIEHDFMQWFLEEIEPLLQTGKVQKMSYREDTLKNLRYSLYAAYNRGFYDAA